MLLFRAQETTILQFESLGLIVVNFLIIFNIGRDTLLQGARLGTSTMQQLFLSNTTNQLSLLFFHVLWDILYSHRDILNNFGSKLDTN